MFPIDPLSEAREHARRLGNEALSERLRAPLARRLLAEALRRAADRLDRRTVVVPACLHH